MRKVGKIKRRERTDAKSLQAQVILAKPPTRNPEPAKGRSRVSLSYFIPPSLYPHVRVRTASCCQLGTRQTTVPPDAHHHGQVSWIPLQATRPGRPLPRGKKVPVSPAQTRRLSPVRSWPSIRLLTSPQIRTDEEWLALREDLSRVWPCDTTKVTRRGSKYSDRRSPERSSAARSIPCWRSSHGRSGESS